MTAFDWTKNKDRRRKQRAKKQRRTKNVHPNSTAARKWGRKTWDTSG